MPKMPSVTLNNLVEVPQLGFGVFQIPPEEVRAATDLAIGAGYRHIDTAAAYGNEAGVGRAVRESQVPRDEIFVTTKLRNADQGYDSTLAAFASSRHELGLDVIDLYLIHWPYPRHNLFEESWRAMEKLYAVGAVRAIGVSNFLPAHLDRLAASGAIVPAVNQIELHPSFQQADLVKYSTARGIAMESYSPLGQGRDLASPVIQEVAAAHGKSVAQVILRWHLQQGFVVIPKSVSVNRMAENIDVLDFELSPGEIGAISRLESGARIGGDPAVFDSPQI